MISKYEIYDRFFKSTFADGQIYLYDCGHFGCLLCPLYRMIDRKCMFNEKLYPGSDPKNYIYLRTWNDVKVFVEEVYRELHN